MENNKERSKEETIELGPGTTYFGVSGGGQKYIPSETYDIPEYIATINGLETTFEILSKIAKDMILKICGVHDTVIQICPDKRVVHLALHGRSKKIRKKNLHRAIKFLEGMV